MLLSLELFWKAIDCFFVPADILKVNLSFLGTVSSWLRIQGDKVLLKLLRGHT